MYSQQMTFIGAYLHDPIVMIRLPVNQGVCGTPMTIEQWVSWLHTCDAADYQKMLAMNRLTDGFRWRYLVEIKNQNIPFDRRAMMWAAMVREGKQFVPGEYAFIVYDADLVKACMALMTKEEILQQFGNGMLAFVLSSAIYGKTKAMQAAFMNFMSAVEPDIRTDLILQSKLLGFDSQMPWNKRIYHFIRNLPRHLHEQAFLLLIQGQDQPGLFNMLTFAKGFKYFFIICRAEQRLDALLVANTEGRSLIAKCIHQADLMNFIFHHLDHQQRMKLLETKDSHGETLFSHILLHSDWLDKLLDFLSTEDIISLCTMRSTPESNHSVIVSTVINGWGQDEVRNAIELILLRLNYRDRLTLITHQYESGCCLMNLKLDGDHELEPHLVDSYTDMIERMLSKGEEIQRLGIKYAEKLIKIPRPREIKSQADLIDISEAILLELDHALLSAIQAFDMDKWIRNFKQILSVRYKNEVGSYISVLEMPFLWSNQFYYELVSVVFEPTDLLQLIQCMISDEAAALTLCRVNVPEISPEGLNHREKISFFRDSRPLLEFTSNLTSLAAYPPTLDAVSSLVFHEGILVALGDIHRYSFKRHVKLYESLREANPGLVKAIYSHNTEWKLLEEAILVHLNGGVTPRQAIENLIRGLRQGGESVSGDETEAGSVALIAVSQFMNYYNELPDDLKNELNALVDSENCPWIKKLPECLAGYFCVEQLSDGLKLLLELNHEALCLDQCALISSAYMATIEKMCRVGVCVEKDETTLRVPLPKNLASLVVSRVGLRLFEFDLDQLAQFPNEFIPYLFEHAFDGDPETVDTFVEDIALAYDDRILPDEKILIILASMANNVHKRAIIADAFAKLTSLRNRVMVSSHQSRLALMELLTPEGLYEVVKGAHMLLLIYDERIFRIALERLGRDLAIKLLLELHREHNLAIGVIEKLLNRLDQDEFFAQLNEYLTPRMRR